MVHIRAALLAAAVGTHGHPFTSSAVDGQNPPRFCQKALDRMRHRSTAFFVSMRNDTLSADVVELCAAGDASHGLTQAERLPASQRLAACKQYLELGRSRRADDSNAKLAKGALLATLANSQMRPIESCESALA